ncbi:MAG: isochorismatase [Planctomycetia bacterium]|nr:isochorismatase [Planctomycetia bacterium]
MSAKARAGGEPLPIPTHFDAQSVAKVWRVPYRQRASEAVEWARRFHLQPACADRTPRICLLIIDCQNTFCIPEFELFVAGRSGTGAVDDNARLCEFIYRNLGSITSIVATMDTHLAMQIFHSGFWVDSHGNHPEPMTVISPEDVREGVWRLSPAAASSVLASGDIDPEAYGLYYVEKLSEEGKYPLTIWPYHAMLGGIGHALVSAVEEACFFHAIARSSQVTFEVKGDNPLTENYSAISPDVTEGPGGRQIAEKNTQLIDRLFEFDVVIIAGEAKSHCVAWTIEDILMEIKARDDALAGRFYLLDDCTSPVVVPGVADFTEQADAAFQRFADAGMHIAKSTDFPAGWPGMTV